MKKCPCGLEKTFSECCGPFIHGDKFPPTPEALMRSRYTAYTLANMEYIAHTMKSPASDNFDSQKTRRWAQHVVWLKLEVLNVALESDIKGFVEFLATYSEKGKKNSIHERSEFHLIEGRWFYIQGTNPTVS